MPCFGAPACSSPGQGLCSTKKGGKSCQMSADLALEDSLGLFKSMTEVWRTKSPLLMGSKSSFEVAGFSPALQDTWTIGPCTAMLWPQQDTLMGGLSLPLRVLMSLWLVVQEEQNPVCDVSSESLKMGAPEGLFIRMSLSNVSIFLQSPRKRFDSVFCVYC